MRDADIPASSTRKQAILENHDGELGGGKERGTPILDGSTRTFFSLIYYYRGLLRFITS